MSDTDPPIPSKEEIHDLYLASSRASREYQEAADRRRRYEREERERQEQERQDTLKADLAKEYGIEDPAISNQIFDIAVCAANDRSEGDTDWDDVPDFYRDIANLVIQAVTSARA